MRKLNPIPQGGSILTPKIPIWSKDTTICDNGGRVNTIYRKNGRKVNIIGSKHIKHKRCLGCNGFKCSKVHFDRKIGIKKDKIRKSRCCGYHKSIPRPVLYFRGPLTTI